MNADALTEKCLHPKAEARRRTIKDGKLTIALQCLQCGSSLKHLAFADYDINTLKPWSQELKDDYERRRSLAWKVKGEEDRKKFNEEYFLKIGPFWGPYLEYLKTPHWDNVRHWVLQRDNICQRCFNAPSVQAHHLTYETFKKMGFSFPAECVGICVRCHKMMHPESGM